MSSRRNKRKSQNVSGMSSVESLARAQGSLPLKWKTELWVGSARFGMRARKLRNDRNGRGASMSEWNLPGRRRDVIKGCESSWDGRARSRSRANAGSRGDWWRRAGTSRGSNQRTVPARFGSFRSRKQRPQQNNEPFNSSFTLCATTTSKVVG